MGGGELFHATSGVIFDKGQGKTFGRSLRNSRVCSAVVLVVEWWFFFLGGYILPLQVGGHAR